MVVDVVEVVDIVAAVVQVDSLDAAGDIEVMFGQNDAAYSFDSSAVGTSCRSLRCRSCAGRSAKLVQRHSVRYRHKFELANGVRLKSVVRPHAVEDTSDAVRWLVAS